MKTLADRTDEDLIATALAWANISHGGNMIRELAIRLQRKLDNERARGTAHD